MGVIYGTKRYDIPPLDLSGVTEWLRVYLPSNNSENFILCRPEI